MQNSVYIFGNDNSKVWESLICRVGLLLFIIDNNSKRFSDINLLSRYLALVSHIDTCVVILYNFRTLLHRRSGSIYEFIKIIIIDYKHLRLIAVSIETKAMQ